MKKILTFIIAIAVSISMFTTIAMAKVFIPDNCTWNLEVELRKADSANVKKDGVIGELEYEKIEIDAGDLFVTYNTNINDGEDAIRAATAKIKQSVEYYASWDETNGLNLAVRYQPAKWENKYVNPDGEFFLAAPAGGLLLQVVDNNEDLTNIIYAAVSLNTVSETLMKCVYQDGYAGDYTVEEDDIIISYEPATGYVTYEWSLPMNQVVDMAELETAVGSDIYFNIGISTGEGTGADGWDACNKNLGLVNTGHWGFYVDQTVVPRDVADVSKLTVSDVAVGYVAPQPTVEPTVEPTVAPTVEPVEEPDNSGLVSMIAIIVNAVAIVIAALAIVLVAKKK